MTKGRADTLWVSSLLAKMRGRRIAVIGDLMLDEWLWGDVSRISPEAPVPVVEIRNHSYTLGGAGNVANNLAALGADVSVIGVIGDDAAGSRMLQLLKRGGIDHSGVERIAKRPTTQKTRIVAHNQQLVRADRESTEPVEGRTRERLRRSIRRLDGAVVGVVISDYGKGLVTAPLVETVSAFDHRVIAAGDPKPQNIDAFVGIDCIAPNAAEAAVATGITVKTEDDLVRAAAELLRRTRCRYVLITRGEFGMTLFQQSGKPFTVPAVARQVYDVSGAGDTVISTLTLALAAGAPIARAVALANVAAGVVVEKLGTATASPQELNRFAAAAGVAAPSPTDADASRGPARARRR